MHELSVCQALLTQVGQIAQTRGADDVKRIIVAVGPLSGVEPGLLKEAFRLARAGGCAARAELRFEPTAVKVRCAECGAESACTANCLLCIQCGGYRTRLISGDELLLLRVEFSPASEQQKSTKRVH